jgi:YebC/PmpR family DNA-binding regulatory protein
MAGHSKWKNIRLRKGKQDAIRGKIFTKLSREIIVAAKMGGGDPATNPRLRLAIAKARENSVPADNIKRSIQRGTGEIEGADYEEVTYEGYGPGGAALFVTGTTDNRNRTTSEIRKIFSSHGGNMGESGCVAWMFQAKGHIAIDRKAWTDEDKLMGLAIDSGSEDIKTDDPEVYEIVTAPADLEKVKQALEGAKVPLLSAENTMLPQNYVELTGGAAGQMVSLIEELEGHDDVKEVYANADIKE